MPKPTASSSGPALRRNQACQQCRRRKLKCDAGRPHCGTCVRQWNALIAVPPPVGFSHPSAPTCSYDPVEGVPVPPETIEDPVERIRAIEAQIEELQNKLKSARREAKQKGHDVGGTPSPHIQQLSPEMARSTRGNTSGSDKSRERSSISPQPYLFSSSPVPSRPSTSTSVPISERKHNNTPYARPRPNARSNTLTSGSGTAPARKPPVTSRSLPPDYSPQTSRSEGDWDPNLPGATIMAHL
ncbi:Fungal Zn(2)-Cys(6) binuclear cluster domain [Ceratobasidium sp. AG-Ba]|nr:Fungal Zn(2)-Cys(6) binuclear cluster domain [Ceratobasidium sp. AG-Ba]